MVNWINKSGVYDFTGYYGFIYRIDYDDGNYYYGKKSFISARKKAYGKKKLAEVTDKRLKKYHIVQSESNWRKYEGSCKEIGNRVAVSKTILRVCETPIDLTYREAELLIKSNVLFENKCLNKNILGKFYSGRLTGGKE